VGAGLKIAIVAALEREAGPLVKHWRVQRRQHEGREFKFFEHEDAVLVCAGMGAPAARRATEAVINFYHPSVVISAGFAGALQPELKAGELFAPETVIDAKDGSRIPAGKGSGILVSFDGVAGPGQKAKLGEAYGAQAVDMEAAAVARGAQAHGIGFIACKVISDPVDFPMPPVARFVGPGGEFRMGRFLFFLAPRPWLWKSVQQLAHNSALASNVLGRALEELQMSLNSEDAALLPGAAG
jgi:adenosylhomocysteine nucleosidase